jgi:hypothetical protein
MSCRNGCEKPVVEDELCEDCLVNELVEFAKNYDPEKDPERVRLVMAPGHEVPGKDKAN